MTATIKRYNSIDLTKLIMAIFVVAIHTEPLSGCTVPIINTMWDCVVRCAEPFFFLSSGYLLAKKAENTMSVSNLQQIIYKHLIKIIRLYLFWFIAYIPLAICHFLKSGNSLIEGLLSYLRGFLIIGESYNAWMLWYLLSTIYALVFVTILLRWRVNVLNITLSGAIIFLLGLLITEITGYAGELPYALSLCRKILQITIVNGRIFTGFFYIPLGMLLSESKLSCRLGAIFTLFGFVGNIFLNGLIGEIVLAVCSVGLFLIVTNIDLNNSPIYSVMRNASTTIYFIHMYVWTAYYSLVYHEKQRDGIVFL